MLSLRLEINNLVLENSVYHVIHLGLKSRIKFREKSLKIQKFYYWSRKRT
jgi:hypothetical protein